MPQHDDGVRLRHMLDAASQAVAFIQGRSRPDLDKDLQLALALTRLVHAYFDVDHDRLWQIVSVGLPALLARLERAG